MVVALLRIVHPVTTLATIAGFIAMSKQSARDYVIVAGSWVPHPFALFAKGWETT